jgi:8-oxo-dGTP pyrophosphatase MutT (NUDIX family)
MKSDSDPIRHSDVVFVLAKLRVRGRDYALLNAHPKWGDWSLVGGHVEPTDVDWRAAAAREVEEEMAPLRRGADVDVEPLDACRVSEWGPVPSVSAGGRPTTYRARWYLLRFRSDPARCLEKLSQEEFRLVPVSDLAHEKGVSAVVSRAGEVVPGGWNAVPLSWDADLDELPTRGAELRSSSSAYP